MSGRCGWGLGISILTSFWVDLLAHQNLRTIGLNLLFNLSVGRPSAVKPKTLFGFTRQCRVEGSEIPVPRISSLISFLLSLFEAYSIFLEKTMQC